MPTRPISPGPKNLGMLAELEDKIVNPRTVRQVLVPKDKPILLVDVTELELGAGWFETIFAARLLPLHGSHGSTIQGKRPKLR